jgi:hypothetical protein
VQVQPQGGYTQVAPQPQAGGAQVAPVQPVQPQVPVQPQAPVAPQAPMPPGYYGGMVGPGTMPNGNFGPQGLPMRPDFNTGFGRISSVAGPSRAFHAFGMLLQLVGFLALAFFVVRWLKRNRGYQAARFAGPPPPMSPPPPAAPQGPG